MLLTGFLIFYEGLVDIMAIRLTHNIVVLRDLVELSDVMKELIGYWSVGKGIASRKYKRRHKPKDLNRKGSH